MGALAWLATSRAGRIAAAALGVLALIGAVWLSGRRSERAAAARERLVRYRTTREKIDAAVLNAGDVDADREWLRDRGE